LIKTMAAMEEYGQPSFRRLHFTGQLPGQLKQLYGPNAVEAITGMEVTKQNVGNRLAQPYRYAVLATHGILDNHLPYVQEPALVLTQVTPAVSGNTGAASPDDPLAGFLTLTDVMGLKIPASLVSLTACSTGLGRELTGEGVMNMGRAFQYAGVRHILMTLWSVSEITTVQLTERIFARLKNGQEPLDAVRGARADLRQAGYDHPYFWAPFILVGR
jgi:CHAT domain-containing protein